jgi:hypothetical protein
MAVLYAPKVTVRPGTAAPVNEREPSEADVAGSFSSVLQVATQKLHFWCELKERQLK